MLLADHGCKGCPRLYVFVVVVGERIERERGFERGPIYLVEYVHVRSRTACGNGLGL